MSADQPPVTMSDIAAKLRLSTMTVSRALRNAAGVKVETRKRVVEAARFMHYRPDAALGVLNMYRHSRRTAAISEKIAFVTNFPTAEGWRNIVTFARYFEGASKRARQLGYELEPFWLGAAGLSANRASEILRNRGVRGVIVGPLVRGHTTLQLNWELFSSVALGLSLETPGLATASANHFQGMELACREVTRRGYTRIGYAVTLGDEARTLGRPRASFRMQQEKFSAPWIPPLVVSEFAAGAFARS